MADQLQFESVDEVVAALDAQDYLADTGLATAVFLALSLGRPLFLEGEPGVGKTELAKALASCAGAELLRLQCYEGIDASQAVYSWDYSRQLLHLRTLEATGAAAGASDQIIENELYSERFLIRRALLEAILPDGDSSRVLLIDEVDRADDEFEAFLLEVLADYAVTVPELGRFEASTPPVVVITSNRTRDVHDALKRRCLYAWVEHPSVERELEILERRIPEVPALLSRQVATLVATLREQGLYKPPGVAESIDWARSIALLGEHELSAPVVDATLGAVLKYREDAERIRAIGMDELLAQMQTRLAG